MYEFEVQSCIDGDVFIIYGYNFYDACARANIDPEEVEVIHSEYVD